VTVQPEPADASGGQPGADATGSSLQVNAGTAVPIQLRFTTVGALHQGYFGRPALVQKLGKGLGACTTHTVDVDVVWSQANLEGRVVAVVPAGSTSCTPTRSGDVVDLRPLVPMSRAVARYRDAVANSSDLRVANFVVALDWTQQGTICRLRAAGQYPPDGTRYHPCIHVNGQPACAAGDAEKGVESLRFTDPAAARLASPCFR